MFRGCVAAGQGKFWLRLNIPDPPYLLRAPHVIVMTTVKAVHLPLSIPLATVPGLDKYSFHLYYFSVTC